MDNTETIGERIRHAMEHRKWRIETLAQAVGLPPDTVSKHISGEFPPTSKELQRYAGILGISTHSLLSTAGLTSDARSESAPSLAAIQDMLIESWDSATPMEREQLFRRVRSLSEKARKRRAKG